jgi:hypothetical protein
MVETYERKPIETEVDPLMKDRYWLKVAGFETTPDREMVRRVWISQNPNYRP